VSSGKEGAGKAMTKPRSPAGQSKKRNIVPRSTKHRGKPKHRSRNQEPSLKPSFLAVNEVFFPAMTFVTVDVRPESL